MLRPFAWWSDLTPPHHSALISMHALHRVQARLGANVFRFKTGTVSGGVLQYQVKCCCPHRNTDLMCRQPPQYLDCHARQVSAADVVLCIAVEGCLTAIYAFVILVRRSLATPACPCVLHPRSASSPNPRAKY